MEPTPPVVKPGSSLLRRLATPKILLGIFAGCAVLVAVPVIAYAALLANHPAPQSAVPYSPGQPSSEPSNSPTTAPAQPGAAHARALAGSLTAINGESLTIQLRGGTATLVLGSDTPIFDITTAGTLMKSSATQLQPGEMILARGATSQADGTYQARSVIFGSSAAFQAYRAQHARPGPTPTPTPTPGA